MLTMPDRPMTDEARKNLARFYETSAAREFEQDSRMWSVVEWTWESGPPLRVSLRDGEGQVLDFVMDDQGVWNLMAEPITPRFHGRNNPG